ncbi:hypothetical protein [Ruegeria sp. HKCCA0370]|uniref:hypothetical protein n=1 Tax=Ruegeria sp. HKCCA0370 TaxID=2682995 RepID=UPI001488208E|nr:hypothetical protein [Ruegeria sp. HKCCA0370]
MNYFELWKQSHWLSASAEAFAKHFYKDEWVEAQNLRGDKHFLQVFCEALVEASPEVDDGFDRVKIGAQKLSAVSAPQFELKSRATDEIVKLLRKGVYRAYGFDRPRTLDLEPVQIPREAWNERSVFEKNEVHYQSLRFIGVRVRMMRAENDPLLKAQPCPVPAKAGRPTVAPAIEMAFHALNKMGEIDLSASQMSHYPKVREWLEKNGADLPVPANKISSETIRRIISPLFKELRGAKKQ